MIIQLLHKKLIKNKKETIIYNKTGLLIDAYFSATKIKWIIDNVPKAKDLIKKKIITFNLAKVIVLPFFNKINIKK